MIIDFAFYLTIIVLITGMVTLLDKLFFAKKRRLAGKTKPPLWIEYMRAFFPVLLAVWILRSFIFQPYRVPTGSLEPTIMPGDFIAVEQFAYGLRLPMLNQEFLNIGKPKRGDIALFRWPRDPNMVFVKRVIGLPGDHVTYKNKVLYINGKKMGQTFLYRTNDVGPYGYRRLVEVKQENLEGIKHDIYVQPYGGEIQNYHLVVPPRHYFVMGDNRDDSDDSRQWGFVPAKNLIGKAFGIWMSWNPLNHDVRWHRVGIAL